MRIKYLVVLVLFFGNLFASLLGQQSRDMAIGRMLMTDRQRFMLRMNEVMMYAAIVMMILFLCVTVYM